MNDDDDKRIGIADLTDDEIKVKMIEVQAFSGLLYLIMGSLFLRTLDNDEPEDPGLAAITEYQNRE